MSEEVLTDLAPLAENKGIALNCAGDALVIGSDTLLYRLDRIAEILDLNYNDSEQMLTFQLALKAFLMCQ